MLLAQPFDPFKEQQQQKRKLPFFAKFRLFSRTRRALCELKNRMHNNNNNRQFHQTALMISDHQRFLMNGPLPPQGWYPPPPCYGYCYDPYFSSPPIMFPPPPPLQSFSMPLPHQQQHQVPYCLCVHFAPSHHYNRHQQENASSIPTESTLYSSNSSMYSNEKELVLEQVDYDIPQHPLEKNKSSYSTMTRRNSDILPNRPGRPSLYRWNTSHSSVYYN